MPRKNRRDNTPPSRRGGGSDTHRVEDGDATWQMRRISGDSAAKEYRCPGCDLLIAPGTGHVVAWDETSDGSDRRHWHTGCWNARKRRRPGQF